MPEKFRVGLVSFAGRAIPVVPPTVDRAAFEQGLQALRPAAGTALGDAIRLSVDLARRSGARSDQPPPAAVVIISDGATNVGRAQPTAAAGRARALRTPIYTVVLGTPNGQIERTLVGGFKEITRVPPSPQTLQAVARTSGGEFFTAARSRPAEAGVQEARLAARDEEGGARDHRLLLGRRGGVPARRRDPVDALVPEGGVMRAAVVAACALVALTAGVGDARATNECRGLMVCVPVAGPWVVVPTTRHAEFQLACPRGYIVGGLDAELSDRAIDLSFPGLLGSPVNPGVTTTSSAVFAASLHGRRAPRHELPSAHRVHPVIGRRRDAADGDLAQCVGVPAGAAGRSGACGTSSRSPAARRAALRGARGTSGSSARRTRSASTRRALRAGAF